MSEMNQCVQRKMEIISKERPQMPKKQKLAVAFAHCKKDEKKEDFFDPLDVIQEYMDTLRTDATFEPPDLLDQDTGAFIRGKANLPTRVDQPMIPVMSEDVKGMGIIGSDLLVQFHNNKGTYRYHMESFQSAQAVFKQMYTSPSKGRFMWSHFRGHVKGESTFGKLGPSYGGPHKDRKIIQTVGGTYKSNIPYDIGIRSPIQKLGGYQQWERVASELKMLKRDPIKSVGITGIHPPTLLPTMTKLMMKMTGKPLTLDEPSVAKKLAKAPSFKSAAQIIQGVQELRARNYLKKLQTGNIIKGVI